MSLIAFSRQFNCHNVKSIDFCFCNFVLRVVSRIVNRRSSKNLPNSLLYFHTHTSLEFIEGALKLSAEVRENHHHHAPEKEERVFLLHVRIATANEGPRRRCSLSANARHRQSPLEDHDARAKVQVSVSAVHSLQQSVIINAVGRCSD